MKTHITAIILAAGCGSRMKLNITKQRLLLAGESILYRTVRAFEECLAISSIVVVCREDEVDFAKGELSSFSKVQKIVVGGDTRAKSAQIGFSAIPSEAEYVAIHDAARCFVTGDIIEKVIEDAKEYGAATASCKISDTVKFVDSFRNVTKTLDRESLMAVQTPQIFRVDLYKKAISESDLSLSVTDDNMLLESIGVMPHCTDTGKGNIKITTADDLIYANYLVNLEKNNV